MADFVTEIREQPVALERLLAAYSVPSEFERVRALARGRRAIVFAGMGASLFGSMPAVYYLGSRGIPAEAADAGELLHYRLLALARRDTLLIAVSQSGQSFETVSLVQHLRNRSVRPPLVAITNVPESALARMADVTLPLFAGPEESTTSKTFVNTVALLLMLAAVLTGDSFQAAKKRLLILPERLSEMIDGAEVRGRHLASFLASPSYLPIIGRGPSLASAMHGALVLKEAAGVGAEGFSGAGFRHGPFEMVGPNLSAVVIAGGRTADLGRRLARTIAERGSRVVMLSPHRYPAEPHLLPIDLPAAGDFELPMLEIVPLQFLAVAMGKARGLEPGALRISGKIVQRE